MSQTRNQYKDLEGRLNVTGKNINRIRLEKNLSAQQISDRLIMIGIDIHRQAIYDIENGKRTVADYELAAIAEELGVTPNDLLLEYTKHLKDEKNN
ncbi:MAG: helix-turn-helix transcriptional regulator [Clostridia bacterium]|nr:helix-turn-helix transcriptional regulator [Clostridia bacterium]